MRNIYILLFTLFTIAINYGQNFQLSENSEISIITIGPGTSLADAFGHNGFRIKDTENGLDQVYDYGRYDFETPNFLLKFASGKLLYELGTNRYQPFENHYRNQNRTLKEQTLNLTLFQKQALFEYLQINALPENKKYKYDFFYDNCATKIRDVLKEVMGESLIYNDAFINETSTFRELIQDNLYWNSWGSMGIDVALGAIIDQEASAWEHQFLPEYIFQAAETATITNNGTEIPLVKNSEVIFRGSEELAKPNFLASPLFVFSIIALLILLITYRDWTQNKRTTILDALLFGITGLIGILLFLLWTATDHTATANNYNMLWAFPLSLFLVTLICRSRPKRWLHRYVFFLLLLLSLLTFHWISGVQVFAVSLIPILFSIVLRYVYLYMKLKQK